MKKVILGILRVIAMIISVLVILLGVIVAVGIVRGTIYGHLSTDIYIFGGILLLISILCGWYIVHTIISLIGKEKIGAMKASMEERKAQRDEEKSNRRMEELAEARKEKEEQYKKFKEVKAKEELIIKRENQEREEREKDLADDDIMVIHRPVRRGISIYMFVFILTFIPFYIAGTLMFALSHQELIGTGMRVVLMLLGWYLGLILLFMLALAMRNTYKNGTLQLIIRTRKNRLYYFMIVPRYHEASQSVFKLKKMMEDEAIIEGNRRLYNNALEFIHSEECEEYLQELIHRKLASTGDRVKFCYLEDYKVRHGIFEDTIYYYDYDTKKKVKLRVPNVFDNFAY